MNGIHRRGIRHIQVQAPKLRHFESFLSLTRNKYIMLEPLRPSVSSSVPVPFPHAASPIASSSSSSRTTAHPMASQPQGVASYPPQLAPPLQAVSPASSAGATEVSPADRPMTTLTYDSFWSQSGQGNITYGYGPYANGQRAPRTQTQTQTAQNQWYVPSGVYTVPPPPMYPIQASKRSGESGNVAPDRATS
jgi:hypothetical protein